MGYSIENDISCVFLMNVPEKKRIPELAAPILMEIQELVLSAKLAHLYSGAVACLILL